MRKKRGWIVYAVVALSAVLLVALLVLAMKDKPKTEKKAEIQERAARLEQERDRLISRRDSMQQNYLKQKNHPATEHLLFLELDPLLYEEVFPMMEKLNAVGSMGLYPGNLPGDEGLINREQFDELLEAGWDCFLVCDSADDFKAWDLEMTARLEAAGIAKPGTVYFEKDTFDPALQEEILSCGYRIAVHHGENQLSMIGKDTDDELWLTGAQPWNYQGVRVDLQELVRFRGDKCYMVNFSRGIEEYAKSPFSAMLEYVKPYLDDGSLLITSFSNARTIHSPAEIGEGVTEAQWEQEKAEIEQQIQEINEQIQAIYDEWNNK